MRVQVTRQELDSYFLEGGLPDQLSLSLADEDEDEDEDAEE